MRAYAKVVVTEQFLYGAMITPLQVVRETRAMMKARCLEEAERSSLRETPRTRWRFESRPSEVVPDAHEFRMWAELEEDVRPIVEEPSWGDDDGW